MVKEPLFVIDVWNCRAAVSKRIDLANGSWGYQPARNWEDLEADAIEAVEAQGGTINVSGLYLCPLGLVERAIFD
jgi:hypothetical protein